MEVCDRRLWPPTVDCGRRGTDGGGGVTGEAPGGQYLQDGVRFRRYALMDLASSVWGADKGVRSKDHAIVDVDMGWRPCPCMHHPRGLLVEIKAGDRSMLTQV